MKTRTRKTNWLEKSPDQIRRIRELLLLHADHTASSAGVPMHSPGAFVVAVVDDDRRVLESLQELLESAGFVGQMFGSAAEFLDSGALTAVHCLISDIRMPAIDGWELGRIASRERPELPIILISGDDTAQRDTPSTPTNGQPRILFKKPFDAQELLTTIGMALQRRTS